MPTDEMDRMEHKLGELQKQVDGVTTEVNISTVTHERIWAEMTESNEYLDM